MVGGLITLIKEIPKPIRVVLLTLILARFVVSVVKRIMLLIPVILNTDFLRTSSLKVNNPILL
jgi:hypothetical protein